MKQQTIPAFPTVEQLEEELKRESHHGRFWKTLRSTVAILVVVAAVAVLISNLLLPVLRIYGTSMTPYPGQWKYRCRCARRCLPEGGRDRVLL